MSLCIKQAVTKLKNLLKNKESVKKLQVKTLQVIRKTTLIGKATFEQ